MFIAEIITEAGAGASRILHHVQNGTPFIAMSAFREELPHEVNLGQDVRLKRVLQGLPVSYIQTEGEYTAKGETTPSAELSYFIMPAKEWSPQSLLMLGERLCKAFNQEAILYGDGEMVWLIYQDGEKDKIGNRVTFNPKIINKLPGFSKIKQRKFSATDLETASNATDLKTASQAAIYGQRIPPKKLDRVRNLP